MEPKDEVPTCEFPEEKQQANCPFAKAKAYEAKKRLEGAIFFRKKLLEWIDKGKINYDLKWFGEDDFKDTPWPVFRVVSNVLLLTGCMNETIQELNAEKKDTGVLLCAKPSVDSTPRKVLFYLFDRMDADYNRED